MQKNFKNIGMGNNKLKPPKKLAEQLIADFIQMMPDGIDKIGYSYAQQYNVAKVQAEYVCCIAKHSHEEWSDKFEYFKKTQEEINKL